MKVEDFLNEILKPFSKIIMNNDELRTQLESIIMKYQFEFDTDITRDRMKMEIEEYITDYIIENRNNKLDKIL